MAKVDFHCPRPSQRLRTDGIISSPHCNPLDKLRCLLVVRNPFPIIHFTLTLQRSRCRDDWPSSETTISFLFSRSQGVKTQSNPFLDRPGAHLRVQKNSSYHFRLSTLPFGSQPSPAAENPIIITTSTQLPPQPKKIRGGASKTQNLPTSHFSHSHPRKPTAYLPSALPRQPQPEHPSCKSPTGHEQARRTH